jgi:SAM-dependent methyltransferase
MPGQDRPRRPSPSPERPPLDRVLPQLVELWRERSRVATGAELHEAAMAVRELSRGFTRERSLAGARYMDDPRLLGGYLLYFWPVSFAQTWAALRFAGVGPRVRRVLDLGAGPGPSSAALLALGCADVMAVDRSAAALELARDAARRLGYRLRTAVADLAAGTGLPSGPFDLVTVVHTLNELWHGDADRLGRRQHLVESLAPLLAPGGLVLVVEPALTRTANEAIELRDALVLDGWRVERPCSRQGRCPAIPSGTCHAEVSWQPPPALVRLAHAARIGRESLTFTYFLLSPPSSEEPAPWEDAPLAADPTGLYRVVSERFLAKSGRLRVLVCGPAGRFPLSVDSRSAAPAARVLRGLRRYDLVRIQGAEKRETGLGITSATRLEVVDRAPRL